MYTKYLYLACCFFIAIHGKSQNLQDYLSIAEKNNLELQANQYQYESALEKINEVGSLPNTSIGVGYFVQEAETRVGAQKAKLSISQKIPWFGTLTAKEESASFKAEAQLNTIDFTKRKLFLDVKTRYFDLFEIKATKNILNENLEILKTFEKLALNELENNRSSMVDVLKIKMEKNELENNLNAIIENYKAKQIAFNLLLNRDEHIVVNALDSIFIQEGNDLFQKELISTNPKLLQLDNLKSSLEKSELAAKNEGYPQIGVGLDYVFVENRIIDTPIDNGKDIVMPMLTVSVPLFSKKYNSKQKQLKLEQKSIESTKVNVLNQLYTSFENSISKLSSAKVSILTYVENIDEAERINKVLLAEYQTSKIDFEQLLEIQQLKLKFQLNKIAAEKQYAIQRATLEFLTSNN